MLLQRLSIDPASGLHPPALVPTAMTAAGLIGAAWIAIAQRRTRPVVAFGLGWFLLDAFFPYVLLPRPEVLNERHMYLAGAGIFLALAALWAELAARAPLRKCMRVAAGALVALLIAVHPAAKPRLRQRDRAVAEHRARLQRQPARAQQPRHLLRGATDTLPKRETPTSPRSRSSRATTLRGETSSASRA